jgi:hypothetical protein
MTTETGTIKDREIFAAGTWNASTGEITIDSDMIDEIVQNYSDLNSKVEGFPVPIKLGHNRRVGEPAFGYATNVRRNGDTVLADFTDVPPEIVDAIRTKRYNSVSIELRPKVAFGGKVFSNVLSAVSLLGAEWPAVKGLKPVYASEFADEGDIVTLSQEEPTVPTFSQEQLDAAVTTAKTELSAKVATLTAQVTDLTNQVTATEAERDTAQAALGAFQDEAEKKSVADLIAAAETDGRIVPANKDKVTALAEKLRSTIKTAEDRKSVFAAFKDYLDTLPKREFKERGQSRSEKLGSGDVQTEINAEVSKLRKANKDLSYKDALSQVFEEHPDLKTRYAEENR